MLWNCLVPLDIRQSPSLAFTPFGRSLPVEAIIGSTPPGGKQVFPCLTKGHRYHCLVPFNQSSCLDLMHSLTFNCCNFCDLSSCPHQLIIKFAKVAWSQSYSVIHSLLLSYKPFVETMKLHESPLTGYGNEQEARRPQFSNAFYVVLIFGSLGLIKPTSNTIHARVGGGGGYSLIWAI